MSSTLKTRHGGRPSRRHEVLQAALDIVTTRGVAAVTPTTLARAVDMTPTAIRYHFADTDEILHALFDPFLHAVDESLARHEPYPNTPVDVRALVADYLETLINYIDVALLVNNDPVLGVHPDFGGRLDKATRKVRNAITGQHANRRARAAAIAAVGSLWRPLSGMEPNDIRSHVDEILDVALSGHPTPSPTSE